MSIFCTGLDQGPSMTACSRDQISSISRFSFSITLKTGFRGSIFHISVYHLPKTTCTLTWPRNLLLLMLWHSYFHWFTIFWTQLHGPSTWKPRLHDALLSIVYWGRSVVGSGSRNLCVWGMYILFGWDWFIGFAWFDGGSSEIEGGGDLVWGSGYLLCIFDVAEWSPSILHEMMMVHIVLPWRSCLFGWRWKKEDYSHVDIFLGFYQPWGIVPPFQWWRTCDLVWWVGDMRHRYYVG